MKAADLRVTFLGGLGDIGRNCAVVESVDAALLIDCGLMFPASDMHGVDLVLPDFSYLLQLDKPIVGCILTHGHEDHHGALTHLLPLRSFPVFGSPWTLALARKRLDEAGLTDRADLVAISDGERRIVGPFDLEFLPVAHSVPDGFSTVIRYGGSTILHSGDWKIDLTPIDGRLTDLPRIGSIASTEGIDLLLGDSTNADEPGHCQSEARIRETINDLFREHQTRRIIAACFASHIHRLSQVIDAASEQDRYIATLGMSMRRNIDLANTLGLLKAIPKRIDIEEAASLPPSQVCVLATGSQGEPMSALSLMANGRSRWLDVGPDDAVIFSTTAISGNESGVARVMDGLARRGAIVIHSGFANVHTSGHAMQEDLKLMLSIAQPKMLIPVHGEFRHMAAHAHLARALGWPPDRVLTCKDGDQVLLSNGSTSKCGRIPAPYVYVDGEPGGVDKSVLRDREALLSAGVIHISLVVSKLHHPHEVVVASKGWVEPRTASEIEGELGSQLLAALRKPDASKSGKQARSLQARTMHEAKSIARTLTGRTPMLLASIIEQYDE